MENKSANKRWKESGTTLSFKEWIQQENEKQNSFNQNFIPFEGDVVKQEIKESIDDAIGELKKESGYKSEEDNSKVFGLNKNVLYVSAAIIAISAGVLVYRKIKAKQ